MPAHAAWDQFEVPSDQIVRKLKGALLHYSFADIGQQMTKMNRVSRVRASETKLKPKWLLALRILFAFPFYLFKSSSCRECTVLESTALPVPSSSPPTAG